VIESRTTRIERSLDGLKVWIGDDEYQKELAELRRLILDLANDGADARELSDERLITIGRQGEVIHALQGVMVDVGAVLNNIDLSAWAKVDSIRDKLGV
jgi:hypothetical protein